MSPENIQNDIIEQTLEITGMTCNHCVMRVKNALETLNGVQSADINLTTKIAIVTTSTEIRPEDLIAAVQKAGYKASQR